MFKTDDGRLFDKIGDAVAHEQSVFLKDGLLPLFQRLLDASSKLPAVEGGDPVGAADLMVAALSADRELAAEFQKLFAKLQLQPVAAVARRRRTAKKAAKTVAPPAAAEQPSAGPPDPPPFAAPVSDPVPSSDHMSAIDSLAASGPIELPNHDEDAPPPPTT